MEITGIFIILLSIVPCLSVPAATDLEEQEVKKALKKFSVENELKLLAELEETTESLLTELLRVSAIDGETFKESSKALHRDFLNQRSLEEKAGADQSNAVKSMKDNGQASNSAAGAAAIGMGAGLLLGNELTLEHEKVESSR